MCPISVKTASPIGPNFFVGPRVTPGKVYGWSNFQKVASKKIRLSLNSENLHFFLDKIREIFFVFVHNRNRIWARSTLKTYSHPNTFRICEHSVSKLRTFSFETEKFERNWVFVTNSTFLISISLLPNVVDLIFQTMNSVRPNNLSLKYQRFTSSDCKDLGIRQFEFSFFQKKCLNFITNFVRYL